MLVTQLDFAKRSSIKIQFAMNKGWIEFEMILSDVNLNSFDR